MTVYYHIQGGTDFINAYPDEKAQEGKCMILCGNRAKGR